MSGLVGIGVRGSVERLLRGDVRTDDLSELFFIIRDEFGGKGIVSEIANFLAHPACRTKGIVWSEVSDYFAFLKFRIPLATSSIITFDVPASLPDAMRANLRRISERALRRKTGKKRDQAQKILNKIFSRLVSTGSNSLSKIILKSHEEIDVFVYVANHSKGGPLFTDDDLFEDFRRALQRQKLLKSEEEKELKKIKPAISLFALTAMHNRKIDLGNNGVAELAITPDIKKRLAIFAVSEVVKDHGMGSKSAAT